MWNKPRTQIATIYANNDMAYILHGTKVIAELLRAIDERPSLLKSKTILDYGCGTGRITKGLSFIFKKAVGYDPSEECIEEHENEMKKINAENILIKPLLITTDLNEVSKEKYDYICCVNVLEHLGKNSCRFALENIANMLKSDGFAILWISLKIDKNLLLEYFGDTTFIKENLLKKSTFKKYPIGVIMRSKNEFNNRN
jgi:2-polyprenyl-3-methyl-5-hydroxy-6-metoxy-1,4-benzoquinol methylase